jgi:putative transposase
VWWIVRKYFFPQINQKVSIAILKFAYIHSYSRGPLSLFFHLSYWKIFFMNNTNDRNRPKLLSDNGTWGRPSCYISGELKAWLKTQEMEHTRGAPYHPQTQGKIERYHRSMKNVVKLENYYYPWELEHAITEWVEHYNHERYHESFDNVTPADVYEGRRNEMLDQRAIVKHRTLSQRKVHNLQLAG